ncbi:hypothetical protein ACFL35_21655, partial [Candidatus Riflebacteria bacterium]
DLPMRVYLRKIVKYQKRLAEDPENQVFRAKIEKCHRFITGKMKKEFESEEYSTFDRLLKTIEAMSVEDRPALIPLLKDIQELLSFKLLQEKDWYASKKLLQLREKLKSWGIHKHFPY